MKQIICSVTTFLLYSVFFCFSFSSCHGQNKAMEEQKKAFSALDAYTPKGVPPGNNIFMKALINGKPWAATKLIPDTDPGSSYHVNGEKDGVQIAFYITMAPSFEVGQTRKFSNDFVADFLYPDNVGFYGGRSGSYTITKVDGEGFEATFQFTAGTLNGNSSRFEITDGTLRFPFVKRRR